MVLFCTVLLMSGIPTYAASDAQFEVIVPENDVEEIEDAEEAKGSGNSEESNPADGTNEETSVHTENINEVSEDQDETVENVVEDAGYYEQNNVRITDIPDETDERTTDSRDSSECQTLYKQDMKYMQYLNAGDAPVYEDMAIYDRQSLDNEPYRLEIGKDYTVTTEINNDGTIVVTYEGKGNYYGCMQFCYNNSSPINISKNEMLGISTNDNRDSYEYTGYQKKPAVTVTFGSTTLINGTDYALTYSHNTDAGTAEIIIIGKGNFKGRKKQVFKITPKPINSEELTAKTFSPAYDYTGRGRKPQPIITFDDRKLIKDKDYTLTYKNNRKIGTATIIVKGIGNYCAEREIHFKICHSIESCTVSTKYASYEYTGYARKPRVTVKRGSTVLKEGRDYVLTYANNTEVGMAFVTIIGKGNYLGSKNITFKLTPKPLTGKGITAKTSEETYFYTGKNRQPQPIVKDGAKRLVKNIDYTVSYRNNINVGKATVDITGIGNYTGNISCQFKIVEKKGQYFK